MALKTEDKIFDSFRGGRYTRNNVVKISDDHVLVANQIIFPGDGVAHKRPGYTLVKAVGFNAVRIFDFRRQSDQQQFIILAGGGKISWMRADGSQLTQLSTGEDPTAVWDFATNTFGLYGSNGVKSYRFVDTGNGLLTKFNWGLQAPAAAPTLTFPGGTLSFVNGAQYAYSWVSKWTDAQGTLRIMVGPPSPLSAFTGVQTSVAALVANLQNSTDAQVTHLWIWRTNDTPFNTTSVLYFLAEVANGTASFSDQIPDTNLDTTKQIPYNNFAPPPASIIVEYQGRFALAGIPGKPDLVQGTGLEEIDPNISISQETAPKSVFFNVPGGVKKITAMAEFNQSLMVSTETAWFQVTGFSAETFQENDNIFTPGAAGKNLVCVTPAWMAWLGRDKKLWAWNGSSDPLEISWKIGRADGSTQLSMESITDAQLATGQLRWYSFGRYNIVALLISTGAQNGGGAFLGFGADGFGVSFGGINGAAGSGPYFDWCQLWDVSVLTGPQGPLGATTKDGMLLGAAESDAFFLDQIIGSGNVLVGSTPYLFLGDNAGNIFRWPDGFTDNGNAYGPAVGSEFTDCDEPDFIKRFRWMDCLTSRQDAASAFGAGAVVSDGVDLDRKPYALPVGPAPAQYGIDPTVFRAKLEQQGTSIGRYIRWFVEFPIDDQPCKVFKNSVKWSVVGKDTR